MSDSFSNLAKLEIDDSKVAILRWVPTVEVRWPRGKGPEQKWRQCLIFLDHVEIQPAAEWRAIPQEE